MPDARSEACKSEILSFSGTEKADAGAPDVATLDEDGNGCVGTDSGVGAGRLGAGGRWLVSSAEAVELKMEYWERTRPCLVDAKAPSADHAIGARPLESRRSHVLPDRCMERATPIELRRPSRGGGVWEAPRGGDIGAARDGVEG